MFLNVVFNLDIKVFISVKLFHRYEIYNESSISKSCKSKVMKKKLKSERKSKDFVIDFT